MASRKEDREAGGSKERRRARGVQCTEERADRQGKVSKVSMVPERGTEGGRGREGARDRGGQDSQEQETRDRGRQGSQGQDARYKGRCVQEVICETDRTVIGNTSVGNACPH